MMEDIMEFESTLRKTAPPSQVCVIYDPRDGRIVHGHVFVGEKAALFGAKGRDERERETLEGARRNHGEVSHLRVLHAPADFRFAPSVAYKVDVKAGRLVERRKVERPRPKTARPKRKTARPKKK
jgi:hypothetical protein